MRGWQKNKTDDVKSIRNNVNKAIIINVITVYPSHNMMFIIICTRPVIVGKIDSFCSARDLGFRSEAVKSQSTDGFTANQSPPPVIVPVYCLYYVILYDIVCVNRLPIISKPNVKCSFNNYDVVVLQN